MIHLSVPVLAHSSSPVPTSKRHWRHSSILAITSEHVTESPEHNFSPQDKQIFRSLYTDILRETRLIQTLFSTDPSKALSNLAELNTQLTLALE